LPGDRAARIGKVAMSRKIWPALAVLFGVAIIAVTVWYIILGVKHPSSGNSITIALLSVIGTPIALGVIGAGYRGLHGPDAAMLKTEAEAQRRAAAALEDAETAEKIKSELEAYVAVRTFRLEIERKRRELSRTVNTALEMLAELNEDEARLGEEKTKLDPVTGETLDSLLQSSAMPKFLEVLLSIIQPIVPIPGGDQLADVMVRRSYEYVRKRELRRLARLVPDALAAPDDHNRSSADG
jgi:hypothetical protein